MKRINYCSLNSKHFMFHCIILAGSVTLVFLVFMLFNYTWLSRRVVNTYTFPLHIPFNLKSFRSQKADATKTDNSKQMSQATTQYKYVINEPKKCKKSNPFLIFLIMVQIWQKEDRQAIRQTWGKEDFLPNVNVLRLFLLGNETKPTNDMEQYLTEESKQYHDIIQQDFMDTYNNLTLKTLMGMHWIATYCPNALYVMKTDSDMFINTEYLVYKLLKPDQPIRKNYFTGYIMAGYRPNRNNESKWYMSEKLYPSNQYPPFCSGTGYVFSADLAAKIFTISKNIAFLHLEDVFVGICLDKLGVLPVPPLKDSDFNIWKILYFPCVFNNLVTSHGLSPSELIRYWNDLQQNKHRCVS